MMSLKRFLFPRYEFIRRGFKYGFEYWISPRYRKRIKSRIASVKRKKKFGSGFLSRSKKIKRRLAKRDGLLCQWCKKKFPLNNLSIDHIIQKSKGGPNSDDNLRLLCIKCHKIKDHPVYGVKTI